MSPATSSAGGRLSGGLLAALLAIPLAACGSGGAAPAAAPASGGAQVAVGDCQLDQALLDAARTEGTVHQMGSTIQPPVVAQMQQILTDEYGIALQISSVRAAETLERIRTETLSGNQTIDTVALGVQYGELMKREGLSEPFLPDGVRENLVEQAEFDADGYWYPFQISLYGVAVNTALTDPASIDDWWALADGTVTGPMVVADPTLGSGGFTWSVAMLNDERFGAEYLTQLGARPNLQYGPVHADNVRRVVAGDAAAYFPFGAFSLGEIGEDARDRVELVYPGGVPYAAPHNLSLVAGAPHPNAARVLMCFLMGAEGQALIAEGGQTPARQGVPVTDERFDLETYGDAIPPYLNEVIDAQDQVETFVREYYQRS